MMKKLWFRILAIVLTIILLFVSFYMFFIHVPYYEHNHKLDTIRNEICETNNYKYDDYFVEYRGQHLYYITRIKQDDKESYVVHDKEKKFVNSFKENVADEKIVIKTIKEKYGKDVQSLDIGYENNKFVYYTIIHEDDTLMYLYYDLATGEFVKSYIL